MSDQEDVCPETREYASPPCFMHELVPGYGTEPAVQDAWPDVCRWRKAERKRLIDERLAIDAEERNARSLRIASVLDLAVGRVSGRIVSGYWPFRGEPDLRNWAIKVIERGGRIALPVVIKKGWPLEFRIWGPGDPLERGVWNILVPLMDLPSNRMWSSRPLSVSTRLTIAWVMAAASSTGPWPRRPGGLSSSASVTPVAGSEPSIRSRTTFRWMWSSRMNERAQARPSPV